MTYLVEANSLNMLLKKAEVVISSLKNVSDEWQYVSSQTIDEIEKSAYKDAAGKYKAMLYFFQIPNLQNNYHGLLSTYEEQANFSRRAV